METDFLQTICYFESEHSDKPFVQEAYKELAKREIAPLFDDLRTDIIEKYEDEYSKLNNQYLSERSFSSFELVLMTLLFYKELLGRNILQEETKKRKQRKLAILGGVVLYTCIFLFIFQDSKKYQEEKTERIKNEILHDSLAIAAQDWSGIYEYSEPSKKWLLEIFKYKSKHSSTLTIEQDKETISLPCSVLIKDYGIQIFPDTVVESMNIMSTKDLLFEFDVEDDDTLTWWYTLRPSNYESVNGTIGFKLKYGLQ